MKNPGRRYEEILAERYGLRRTPGSGNVHGDGDLRHKRFLIEAKDHGKESFNLSRNDFLKMGRQAGVYYGGKWVYFFRNKFGEEAVTMNVDLFNILLSIAENRHQRGCPECGAVLENDW